MKISFHPWPPEHRRGHDRPGVIAIDDESGYAVFVIGESDPLKNVELAERRLRRASVLREQIAERDAEIAQLRSAIAASSKACDSLEDIFEQANAEIGTLRTRIKELEQRLNLKQWGDD